MIKKIITSFLLCSMCLYTAGIFSSDDSKSLVPESISDRNEQLYLQQWLRSAFQHVWRVNARRLPAVREARIQGFQEWARERMETLQTAQEIHRQNVVDLLNNSLSMVERVHQSPAAAQMINMITTTTKEQLAELLTVRDETLQNEFPRNTDKSSVCTTATSNKNEMFSICTATSIKHFIIYK